MNNTFSFPFLISLLLFITACDPGDSRLKVRNESQAPIYITYSSDTILPPDPFCPKGYYLNGNDTITYFNCDARVDPDSTKAIFIRTFKAWEKFIKNQCKDSKLKVFILSEQVLTEIPWDSISNNNLYLKRYDLSLDSIKKLYWIITFPMN